MATDKFKGTDNTLWQDTTSAQWDQYDYTLTVASGGQVNAGNAVADLPLQITVTPSNAPHQLVANDRAFTVDILLSVLDGIQRNAGDVTTLVGTGEIVILTITSGAQRTVVGVPSLALQYLLSVYGAAHSNAADVIGGIPLLTNVTAINGAQVQAGDSVTASIDVSLPVFDGFQKNVADVASHLVDAYLSIFSGGQVNASDTITSFAPDILPRALQIVSKSAKRSIHLLGG